MLKRVSTSGLLDLLLTCMLQLTVLTLFAGACAAADKPTACDPKTGVWDFGMEWVAAECLPFSVNDETPIRYINNALTCNRTAKQVELSAPYGDTLVSPQALTEYIQSTTASDGRHYKIFRNKEGSHFVMVHPLYTGTIDEKDMTQVVENEVQVDFFKRAFVLPPTPTCIGGQFNDPNDPNDPSGPNGPNGPNGGPTAPNAPHGPNAPAPPDPCGPCPCAPNTEQKARSTVNIGTGRLSHSQHLFSINTGTALDFGMFLFYRSEPFAPSAIGNGWSHSYEMLLQPGADNSVIFWMNGKQRLYTFRSGAFSSPKGDQSSLVKTVDGTFIITEKNGIKRYFDASGVASSVSDRFGNTLSFVYSGSSLTRIADQNGRSATFTYDNGKLTTVLDASSKLYTLQYSGGVLTKVKLPGEDEWNYTYNGSNGLLETKKDPRQQSYGYTYQGKRVSSVTTPGGSQSYSNSSPSSSPSPGKIPDPYPQSVRPEQTFTYKDESNKSLIKTYDTLSEKIRSVTDPLGNVTSYTYDLDGNLLSITMPAVDGVRYTTFLGYDLFGNLNSKSEPTDIAAINVDPETVTDLEHDGRVKVAFRYTYDTSDNVMLKHRIKSASDLRNPANILTTNYDYVIDPSGNLVVTVTGPAGSVTTMIRDSKDRVRTVTDANGKSTLYTYRSDGLLGSVARPSGVTTEYTAYDGNGNVTEIQIKDSEGALRAKVALLYDERYRVKSQTVTTTDNPALVTAFGYNGNGNLTSIIDPELNQTMYDYTYSGLVKNIVDALGKETVLTYGASGCPSCANGVDKLTMIEDAKHQQTKYEYDEVGRLQAETDPLGRVMKYTYYENGLLKGKIDATDAQHEKLLFTYKYNSRGQLTSKIYADGSPDLTYTYDLNGRMKTAANGAISYTFDYYDNGRLKSVTDSNGRQISNDGYNSLGQRTQVTVKDGADQRTISHGYDNANRLERITSSAGTFTYTYDKLGRRSGLSYPNGVAGSYSYNDLNRLTSIKHARGSSTITFANYSTFDKVGNRKSMTTAKGTSTYTYNAVYRLTEAATPKGTERYSYDEVGNRLSGPGPKDTKYQYNASNQMIIGRILSYLYDNHGNQVSRGSAAMPGQGWSGTWNSENQMVRMERTKGPEKRALMFQYDPFGRRIEKRMVRTAGGVTRTSIWSYVYDGDDIALEIYVDEAGAVTKTFYTHGVGVDEHLALERSGSPYFYHADGLGSITAITDANGNVVQSYDYDSFGGINLSTNFRNSYSYTGREWDKEAGLYYYRARYYDPMEGRFVSKDPIGFAGGINLYAYIENNPMNFIDPYGLASTPVTDILNGLEFGFRAAGVVVWEGKKAAAQEAAKAFATEYLSKLLRLSEPSSLLVDKTYTISQIPTEASSMKEMAERISDRINNIRDDVYKCE